MNKMKIWTSILIIAIFSYCLISMQKENILQTSGSMGDKTIAWGIKRNDNHEQPDVGATNKSILENNGGICLGKDTNKYIYLTFDSGYEAGYIPKILEVLKNNDVKATFFITAHYLNTASELVKQMIDDGHIIGNHSPRYLMS